MQGPGSGGGGGGGGPSALCELLRLAREGSGSGSGSGSGGEAEWVSVHEGWLLKQSQLLKRWRPRYVQLQVLPVPPPAPQPRRLVYFTAPPPHAPKGVLELCGSSELCEGLVVGQEGGFSLSTGPQSLTLRPQQQQGQDPLHWIEAIAAAITLARREAGLAEGRRVGLCWRLLCPSDSHDKLQAIQSLEGPLQHSPTLTIKVLEARGVMGKDRSGVHSSPYVRLSIGGVVAKSRVVCRSLCPQWHETWVLQDALPDNTRHAAIEVWDWGGGGAGHFLGLIVLPLLTLPLHRWVEGWHVLGKRSPRSRVGGQLRLALHLATTDTHATCLDHTALCALREVQRLSPLNLPLMPFPDPPTPPPHSTDDRPLKGLRMPLVEWEVLEDEASHTLLQLPVYAGQVRVWGRLVLSNYRLVFTSHASQHTPQGEVPWLSTQVALRNIVAVSKKKVKLPPSQGEVGLTLRGLTLRCRDARQLTFLFPPPTTPTPTHAHTGSSGGVGRSPPSPPHSHRRGSSSGLSVSSGGGASKGIKASLSSFLHKPRRPPPHSDVPLESATPVALVSGPSRRRSASGSSHRSFHSTSSSLGPADEATLWTLEDQEAPPSPHPPPHPPSPSLVLDLPSPPHSSTDTADDEEGEGQATSTGGWGGLLARLVYRTLNPTPDTAMLLPPQVDKGSSSSDAFAALLAADYRRMGVPDERWKLSTLNQHFEVCGSYPSLLCVPSSISESFLHSAASCRSKARLPVLTYRHKATMATLCRSSQPLVGLKLLHHRSSGQWGSQCEDDVVLLEHLHAASGQPPTGPPPPPAVLRRRHSEDLRRLRSSEGTAVIEALQHEALAEPRPSPSPVPPLHSPVPAPASLGSAPSRPSSHSRSRSAPRVSVPSASLRPVPEPQPQEQARHDPLQHNQGYIGIDGRRREKLVVLDCRPEINAVANAALHGMGFENTPQYKQVCQVVFLDIANIHVMRKSLDTLQALCFAKEVGSSGFWGGVEGSGWLLHLHKLLSAANVVARLLHLHGVSLLLHCSDGWDRTTQVCGLAQLLLDPYYRTLTGFRALINKEWVAFGHKFAQRAGHPPPSPPPSPSTAPPPAPTDSQATRWGWLSPERSPIFHQWLDAVYQMCRQCPEAFEFSEELLLFLSEHATSGWFGDFLLDCEQDRVSLGVRDRSVSIWEAVQGQRHRFVNPQYRPEVWGGVLPVVGSAKALGLWEGYFFRHQRHAYSLAWRVGSELSPTGGLGQGQKGGAAEPSSRWAAVVDGLYGTDPDVLAELELLPGGSRRPSPGRGPSGHEAPHRASRGSNGAAALALHRSSSKRGSANATTDTQPTPQQTE